VVTLRKVWKPANSKLKKVALFDSGLGLIPPDASIFPVRSQPGQPFETRNNGLSINTLRRVTDFSGIPVAKPSSKAREGGRLSWANQPEELDDRIEPDSN